MSDDQLKQPQYVPDPERVPRPEQPPIASIRPGSGLAVIGLFVEIVRKRFTQENQLPWVWDNDIKKTKIAIESAFNEDSQVRNFRPAIYIDRDEQSVGRTVMGDFVGQQLKSGTRGFWALETVPILIECLAAKKRVGHSSNVRSAVQPPLDQYPDSTAPPADHPRDPSLWRFDRDGVLRADRAVRQVIPPRWVRRPGHPSFRRTILAATQLHRRRRE